MKKITLILLIICSLQLVNAFAQQSQIDSLKQIVSIAKQDTNTVKALNTLAKKYQRINLDTSLIYAQQSLELAKQINYKKGMAEAYKNVGIVYQKTGDFFKAINNWEKRLSLYKELNDSVKIANAYGDIGILLRYQGNYEKSQAYCNKQLEIALKLKDPVIEARAYNALSTLSSIQGKYEEGIKIGKKSLKLQQELGNLQEVAACYNNIAIDYLDLSNFEKANNYFHKSLEIAEEINDIRSIYMCYNGLGNALTRQGNYKEGIDYYQKSIELLEKVGNKQGIAVVNANIGNVYSNQGNYEKYIFYTKKALNIFKEMGDIKNESMCYVNIGSAYIKLDSLELAIEYHEKALKIAKKINDKYVLSRCYANFGIIHQYQGNYTEVLNDINKSLALDTELGDKYGVSGDYGNIASLYIELANSKSTIEERNLMLDSAIYYSNKSMLIAQDLLLKKKINIANKHLSIAYWALYDNNKTYKYLTNLVNMDNASVLMNFSFISEKEKELFFETIKEDYWQFNSFALKYKNTKPNITEVVYNNSIKNKGLLLKSNTAMRNAVRNSKDTMLINFYEKWILLKKEIASKYSVGEDTKDIEIQANDIEAYLVKNSNEFSDFKKIQDISWEQVKANLKTNEVAIEFLHFQLYNPDSDLIDFTNQTQYVALILTKDSKHPKMLPLFEEKQLEKIIGKFGGNNYSYINSIYGKNTEVNKQLYNLIWAPIDSFLTSVSVTSSHADTKPTIYLSPDGLLHKISFPAIAKEQNVYLCDAYDIEVKSTTGKIAEDNRHSFNGDLKQSTATLFGGITYDTDSTTQKIWNYLEGTKTETQAIDKILKKGHIRVNYYNNTSATEEEFKLMANNSNILHIATHGFFYPDPNKVEEEIEKKVEYGDVVFRGGSRGFGVNSFVESRNPLMRSGLVFAGANDVWSKQTKNDSIDDGVLTAQEVSSIDMRKTNLVVMSACETGLGDIKGSEGVYGLQRAFKMAGVDYIIMSLWQVPDKETEEFMTTFYKKLIKQKDIKQAFAETQKQMREKYDPYFWAAFVLIE